MSPFVIRWYCDYDQFETEPFGFDSEKLCPVTSRGGNEDTLPEFLHPIDSPKAFAKGTTV